MVIAIGVDIVQVSRISRLLRRRTGPRFLRRILHQSELATYTCLASAKKDHFVAGAWAAKEAVYKTLDAQDQRRFVFQDWCRHSAAGRPAISYVPQGARSPSQAQTHGPPVTPLPVAHEGDDFLLSISHDNDMLVATILRQRGRSRRSAHDPVHHVA